MHEISLKTLVASAAISLLALGCGDDAGPAADDGGGGGAGGVGGGAVLDSGGAGGAGGGFEPRDSGPLDGPLPDAALPDGAVQPDAAEPDAALPDAFEPIDVGSADQGPPPAMGQIHGGRINRLAIADNPAAAGCRDLNGDGTPDNSLTLAAGLANAALQESVDDGSLNMLPTSIGLDPPGANGQFDLALLTGDAAGDGYQVSDSALDEAGEPRVVFGGTQVAGGALMAGPGDFPVAIPVGDMDLELIITNTTIVGTAGIDGTGFFINGGVISGIIPHDALVAALQNTDFAFAAGLLPADINGTGNSVCLTFSSVGARLVGFPVE